MTTPRELTIRKTSPIIKTMRTGKKAPPKDRYSIDNRGTFSVLTPELILQIEQLVKAGLTNPEIIEKLALNDNTWYSWLSRDTQGIRDKIGEWRRAYLLDISEQGLTKLTKSANERIRLEAIKFTAERLGKSWYSTRNEYAIDEKEGKELEPENKEKLEKLLINKPIISPIQQDHNKE